MIDAERKKVIKKLDTLLSKYIRERDGRCVTCGSRERLQNGHLFSRIAYSTRWDYHPDGNCFAQCSSCNMSHEYDPYPFNNFYINKFGKEAWDDLHRRYKTPKKWKTYELEELYEKIKEEYRKLTS